MAKPTWDQKLEQELQEALLPLVQHGVPHDDALRLVLVATRIFRQGLGLHTETVLEIVKDAFLKEG